MPSLFNRTSNYARMTFHQMVAVEASTLCQSHQAVAPTVSEDRKPTAALVDTKGKQQR